VHNWSKVWLPGRLSEEDAVARSFAHAVARDSASAPAIAGPAGCSSGSTRGPPSRARSGTPRRRPVPGGVAERLRAV